MKTNPVAAIKSAVIGAAIAATPVNAQEPPKSPPAAEQKADIKAVEAALAEQIKALKDEIKALREKQSTYQDMIAGRADGKVIDPADAGVMKRLDTLEASVRKIEESLKQINEKLSATTSAASPLAGVAGAAKARIKIVNEHATSIRIVVNGTSYPLEAAEVKSLDVPAGSFSYQLLAEGTQRVSSNIKDGETVTLRIR